MSLFYLLPSFRQHSPALHLPSPLPCSVRYGYAEVTQGLKCTYLEIQGGSAFEFQISITQPWIAGGS